MLRCAEVFVANANFYYSNTASRLAPTHGFVFVLRHKALEMLEYTPHILGTRQWCRSKPIARGALFLHASL